MDFIVHADDALVVVNKPAGLLAVPGRGADKQDCAWSRLREVHADVLVVHRLDMATSGLMVFARGAAMQRRLSMDFAARRVAKRYVARVLGMPPQDAGSFDWPLAADWPRRPLQRVDALHGRPALTHWRRLASDPGSGTSRLELEPVTGRSHQLRLHLATAGWPILGDTLYGSPAAQALAPRLLLHARTLGFAHPASGEPSCFEVSEPF